ncbi:MAG: ABC transporter permease [Gammaproteobacteria bacterium]|nr:ABC transporter permease [Gammaproteobacteria bacterium]
MTIPFRLAASNTFRSPLRWTLTFLATFVAFMLYTVLSGIVSGLDGAFDRLSDTRLRVLNRTGPLETLPIAHGSRIANLDGVQRVTHATLLGGYFQDLSQPVTSAAVDLPAFLDVVPEIRVPEDQLHRVLALRTGAIVGSSTANRLGWRVGDHVPIQSAIWINDQGNETWTFDVLAIANSRPEDDKMYAEGVFFDYAYLNESRVAGKDTVQHFVVALEDPARAASVAKAIDELFANSSHRTRTLSEKQWVSGQLRQVEDLRLLVELVVGAVSFSLLFLTGTMMVQAARSRRPEFGILKAMGFSDGSISMMILAEAFVICVGGALAGLLAGALSLPSIFEFAGVAGLGLPGEVYATAIAAGMGLAGLISLWPMVHLRRVAVTEAIGGK